MFLSRGKDTLWLWEVEEHESGGSGEMPEQHLPAFPTTLQAAVTPLLQCQQRNFMGVLNNWKSHSFFSVIKVCVPIIAYNSKLFSWMCQFLIWITKSKFYILASEFIGLLEELKYFIFISKQLDSHWTTGFHYWCSFSCLYCWRNAAILHQSVLNSVPRSPSGAHALQREFSWALREGA